MIFVPGDLSAEGLEETPPTVRAEGIPVGKDSPNGILLGLRSIPAGRGVLVLETDSFTNKKAREPG